MKRYHWISIILILLVLGSAAGNTRAQSEDPPLDDEFVRALVMMSVNHNMMAGKDEIRDLRALHSFVTDYYDERIWRTQDKPGADWLRAQKGELTSAIKDEIDTKSGTAWMVLLLSIFTDQYEINNVRKIISGSNDPPDDYFNRMNSLVMTNIESQVNVLLDIDTISKRPDLAPAISDSTAWSHDVSAIIDSTSPLSPFTGNSPVPMGSDNNITLQKPLRFANNGTYAATVVVNSYTPAPGVSAGSSNGSTVVFPDGNPSAQLSLALGEYVFCYYWDLGTDADNDGYVDYAHRNTGKVTMSQTSSDNVASAQVVTLSPENVSTINGKCGENLQGQPVDSLNLTPQEISNQGTNTYTCSTGKGDMQIEDTFSQSIVFSSNGFTTNGYFFTKIEPNVYTVESAKVFFTDAGYIIHDNGGEGTCIRH